jgi:hypothetical protein
MFEVSFNEISFKEDLILFVGDPLETYYQVNQFGVLEKGLVSLKYFVDSGFDLPLLVELYRAMIKYFSNELIEMFEHIADPLYALLETLKKNVKN